MANVQCMIAYNGKCAHNCLACICINDVSAHLFPCVAHTVCTASLDRPNFSQDMLFVDWPFGLQVALGSEYCSIRNGKKSERCQKADLHFQNELA